MSLIIQANISLINTQNRLKNNTFNKAASAEKLSSGYRINRAADDAAGLAISEKMRWQIRGLNKGTDNAQEGVSWIQTGDGALDKVHDIIHRMKELAIQSLNDTNTPLDRAALQSEFDSLQSEIDRISDTTMFNTKNIFEEHEPSYYQFEGNVTWQQDQIHVINQGENDLSVTYRRDDGSPVETVTVSVPAGMYTTQELTDEMDDALSAAGIEDITLEYTDSGTFNVNFEGGEKIDSVGGGLSYLLFDMYKGGSVGALVGTTVFPNENSRLRITSENNNMSFTIESFDGVQTQKNITIPEGRYTRSELIDLLNDALKDTTVIAKEYGTGIKLQSDDSIITGFKGNMFKIDEGANVYTSVFYDNVKYGNVQMTKASFVGGLVIPNDSRDSQHQRFYITSSDNELKFKPNGSDTVTAIVIPEGEYTLSEMVNKLNELFKAEGLELDAVINSSGSYSGIKINSTVMGSVSEVGLDESSSAYNTLFVKRVYNSYSTDAVTYRETKADADGYFMGSKVLTGANVPLTITTGLNDSFKLNIDGTKYTITLNAGTYADADAIRNQIDEQLNGAGAAGGYKDMVNVEVSGGRLKLTAAPGSGISDISAEAEAGNEGYNELFIGINVTYKTATVQNTGTASTKPEIILNTPINDPAVITDDNKNITITVDGVNHTVTLPVGDNITHDDITNAIENQIKEQTIITPNTFTRISAVGTETDNNFTETASGKTTSVSKSYSASGTSKDIQGEAGNYEYNNPAKVTMSVSVPNTMVIDNGNNQFQININGTEKSIGLDNGTYTAGRLVSMLQAKIDDAFGRYAGGATVTLTSDNKLVFQARLNEPGSDNEIAGEDTLISFSTQTGSFIKALHTTETAASVTSSSPLQNSIIIQHDNNTFDFTYTENGIAENISLTLDTGTYDRNSFVAQLNKQLKAQGIPVTASLNGTSLKLATDVKGDGTALSYSTGDGGSSVEALFGEMTTKTAASATADRDLQSAITIDAASDIFNMTVNGSNCNITLSHGTYTREKFVEMLNEKLAEASAGIKAELNGNRIKYTTEKEGKDASFSIEYATGGTSMKAMYGETGKTYAGVNAEFTADNKLKLTGTQNGGELSVSSASGGALQTADRVETPINVTKVSGYQSSNHAYIDGVNITEPVTVDRWNNVLQFDYYADGSQKNVSVTLAEKDYTFSELQTELQNQIDTCVGQGELTVAVSASGVRIQAENPGSRYYMGNFSGGFYDKIICSAREITQNVTPSRQNGTTSNDTAYTVGRKDVKNNDIEIKAGVNDTLSLDFQYGGNVSTITMTLDEGVYRGNSLKDMIQEKLNEQLVNSGFEENTIEVGIGGINTGVVGANDDNALNFKLSTAVRLPAQGVYVIDGVSGNAAFSVFYQTDGEIKEAYIRGTKDINEGVTIEAGREDLSFEVDGIKYTINIPAGEYTSEEIINEINDRINAVGAPVIAEVEKGNIKISHKKLGTHEITNVTGGAKQDLFAQENGRTEKDKNIKIQLSSQKGDFLEIEKPVFSTTFLGINSITITKPKYANKAIDRLDKALDMVSDIRSAYGAIQNRIEYAMRSNQNKSENTQRAESGIRDADMAEEMMEYSRYSILQQAAQALMAQVNANADSILTLLS